MSVVHVVDLRTRRLLVTFLSLALLAGAAVVAPPVAHAFSGDPVTYRGPSYGSAVTHPSADKPQSKLWYADGAWWGLLVSATDSLPHVHELMPNHTWRDTGTVVDGRINSTGDALYAGGKLYVASRHGSTPLRVTRLSYVSSSRTWTVDAGFPAQVPTGGGSESATIDRDSLGRLWVTYTRGSKVWVSHTVQGDDRTWVTPFNPAVPDVAINSDDISALVRMPGQIGVLWSDQGSDTMWFARHRDTDPDGVWTVEAALSGPDMADDHINLKSIDGDSQGRVFAAIKTSQDSAGPGAMLVGVLVRTPRADGSGTWKVVPAGTVADDHSRPIIMIDETSQELYFFATAPVRGGTIYYKKTSLTNPSFAPGRGQPFVYAPGEYINNPSGSKQSVTSATGLVVLASDDGDKLYYHAELGTGGAAGGDTTPPSTPSGLAAVASGPTRVDLSWNVATDDVGVSGYVVRRGGVVVGQASGRTYADTTVAAGTSYSYTVEARDAAGNVSAASAPVSVTTPGQTGGGGGGSISLVASTTGSNTATTSLTLPTPAAPAGTVLLAAVQVRGGPVITPPAGWNLVQMTPNGSSLRLATYWRVAGSAEPASHTWTFSSAQTAVGSVLAYSGVSVASPIDVAAGQANASSTSVTAPSVTTTTAGAQVIGLFATSALTSFVPPTGMTERTDVASPSTVQYRVTASSADAVQATVGATGTRVAVAAHSGNSVGQLVALRPA